MTVRQQALSSNSSGCLPEERAELCVVERNTKKPSYIPELESLRGWAVLMVVAFHYVGVLKLTKGLGDEWYAGIIRVAAAGNSGVSLFFVLSGFFLIRPFLLNIRDGTPFQIGAFYRARVFRILPLYYVAVFVSMVVLQRWAPLKALVFIPIGFDAFPFSPQWWSLSTEVQFYAILPLVMLGLASRRWRLVTAAAILGALVGYAALLQYTDIRESYFFLRSSIIERGIAFVVGGGVAWLSLRQQNRPRASSFGLYGVFLWCTVGGLVVLLNWYGSLGNLAALSQCRLYLYIEAMLWGCVVHCIMQPGVPLKGMLCNPLLEWMGRISYSVYLVHLPIQFYGLLGMSGAAPTTSWFSLQGISTIALNFLLMVLVSAATYRCIEVPFLRLKARNRSVAPTPVG